jgi:dCMP deaminase
MGSGHEDHDHSQTMARWKAEDEARASITKWHDRFLDMAHIVASWSKDPSTKVGCVIVDAKRRVLSVGYNGFPRGVADNPASLNDRPTKLMCTVHAEMNAILNTATPIQLEGATLYATLFPCCECAKAIIQSGVAEVITHYPDSPKWVESHKMANQMFLQSNVKVTLFE